MSRVAVPDDGGDTILNTDFGEVLAPCVPDPVVGKQIFDKIPDLPIKEDDIMLCTYIKTGTNWMFEILSMILKKSAERNNNSSKLFTMLETLPAEFLDTQPSPRILNSHLTPKFLPRDLKSRQTKTILCLRNPKDTCVSHFHHVKSMKPYNYDGKWENFVRPWVQGKFEYGAYTSYLNAWQQVIQDGPGFPLHVIYFEDLKLNGMFELNRLLKFLEIKLDEKLKSDILGMCHIDKMKEKVSIPDDFVKVTMLHKKINKEQILSMGADLKGLDLTKASPQDLISAFLTKENFSFFRKGLIGDWRNVFTVAQNNIFDDIWKQNIRNDTIFTFRYE